MSSGIAKKVKLDTIDKKAALEKSPLINQEIPDPILNLTLKLKNMLVQERNAKGIGTAKEQYLEIVNSIHDVLNKETCLSKEQKLNYCNIERYFMKLYLLKFS
ncbi:MAG: hypothetical protein JW891_18950 [Candidatus Lokiarchaeota archaeon]|nr:hypothetical protein [Candidatus Lokiarchaeota archaeon]